MPTTKLHTVYQFDELDDRAKDCARAWFRSIQDFNEDHAETVIDDAARMGALIGIDIRTRPVKLMGGGTRNEPQVNYSGFSSQGDGASFVGRYGHVKGSVSALAKEAPTGAGDSYAGNNELNRIARELAAVQRRNFYQVQAIVTRGPGSNFYSHSRTMTVEVERADGKPISDEACDLVRELLIDFADWMYDRLEREYEYQTADEQVDDTIRANEYEFTESGGTCRC